MVEGPLLVKTKHRSIGDPTAELMEEHDYGDNFHFRSQAKNVIEGLDGQQEAQHDLKFCEPVVLELHIEGANVIELIESVESLAGVKDERNVEVEGH